MAKLQRVLHLYVCMYMGFVPESKLIRIRIHSQMDTHACVNFGPDRSSGLRQDVGGCYY